MEKNIVIAALAPNYTRRRYGTQTFTWLYFTNKDGEIYTPIQDPYPAVVPAKSFIEEGRQLIATGYYYEKASV